MRLAFFSIVAFGLILVSCTNYNNQPITNKISMKESSESGTGIDKSIISSVADSLKIKHGAAESGRIEKCVHQLAALWSKSDGSADDFKNFCKTNFISDEAELEKLFKRVSANFETIYGHYNKVSTELKVPLHLDSGEVLPIDEIFGGYEPMSHISEDFFNNKIAFHIVLNFPYYSLKEKSDNSKTWSRKQMAYARLGDVFAARVPSEVLLKEGEAVMNADTYISEYNIFMGNLVDNSNKKLFPSDMKLITHWGLRDELKSNYSNKENGLEKQKMVYEVMKKIISQEIPQCVINNADFTWNPEKNEVYKNDKKIEFVTEPDIRYEKLLGLFKTMQAEDKFSPNFPTFIDRKFNREMEISVDEVEKLFTQLLSSSQVKKVAGLISARLGRKLEPFDIWYDGFKARGAISSDELDKKVRSLYPDKEKFEKSLPAILVKLGFAKNKAEYLCEKIAVDASRGAGHALGAEMKGDKARLRTRIGKDGMNYKGYNIAIHEFGHNVEQTLSLYDVDYYMLRGVPNTAFTEALAFVFQKRDLELLGITDKDPLKKHMMALDNFWGCYEIMGVSLVDIAVWKWLYANPDANASQLKQQVQIIAKDIWNKYYADVFGLKDQPILAIYSHMIDAPLYLSAYPIGHLIEFQLEKHLEGKDFAKEVERTFTLGRLVPQDWMRQATGNEISCSPILNATEEAVVALGNKK